MDACQAGQLCWPTAIYDFSKVVVTVACSATASVYFVNRAKSKADFLEKRIDDICSDVRAVADLASDYWMKPAANDLQPLEARISARFMYIARMVAIASKNVPELLSPPVVAAQAKFFRTTTGGNFGVHNRDWSVDRARQCQHDATNYMLELRNARSESYNSHTWLKGFFIRSTRPSRKHG